MGSNFTNSFGDLLMSARVVITLTKPLMDKEYCLTMDNFYYSPGLTDTLVKRKTDVCGTLRLNSKDEGVKDDPQHVKAVTRMDTPTHKAGVRFLGVVNYGSKCIPNASSITFSLRNLVTDKNEFQWFAGHESK
ncbi:piggyBac transposable element-derived protein 4 [Nephila pilipes]|uniref:PiggyBac transposable element-derived protein 4 n=1 Tax=Nephila pilipes TaxID=299642 RepID=A0A8X6NC30_NEPPI|nr:piggyBac transposable element-derived protein 4 [Nephila pilipes]